MSFQPLPNPPTAVVVPEMVPRGTVKTVFNPAADNFAQSLNPFSLYLQDFRTWVQNANQLMYDNVQGVYEATVTVKEAAAQSAAAAQGSANAANDYASLAQSAANFKGRWSQQSGDATVPLSVYHNEQYWMLLNNVSNIATHTPGVSNVWGLLQTFPVVRTPIPVSPLSGQTSVSVAPRFEAGPYANVYDNDPRAYREFQADTAAGDFSSPLFSEQVDADFIDSPVTLSEASTTKWRCRDVSITGVESRWMTVQSFSTGTISVSAPTITIEGAPNEVPEEPIITFSPFEVLGGTDTYLQSKIELYEGITKVYEDTFILDTATWQFQLPPGTLIENTQNWTMRGKHVGETYGESEWRTVLFNTEESFSGVVKPAILTSGVLNKTADIFTSQFAAKGLLGNHAATKIEAYQGGFLVWDREVAKEFDPTAFATHDQIGAITEPTANLVASTDGEHSLVYITTTTVATPLQLVAGSTISVGTKQATVVEVVGDFQFIAALADETQVPEASETFADDSAITRTISEVSPLIYSSAWRAFDKNSSTAWGFHGNEGQLTYTYDLERRPYLSSYRVTCRSDVSSAPSAWTMEGSFDGNDWIELDTRTAVEWTANESKLFNLPQMSGTGYAQYRLTITDNNGGEVTEIAELVLFTHTQPSGLDAVNGNAIFMVGLLTLETEYSFRVGKKLAGEEDYTWSDEVLLTTPSEWSDYADIDGLTFDAMVAAGKYDTVTDTGFFGEVPAATLFTGPQIASAIGLTAGKAQHNNEPWLKFYVGPNAKCNRNGGIPYILYIAKKPYRHTVSWDAINARGAVYWGTGATVQKAGHTLDVGLMFGAYGDPADSTNAAPLSTAESCAANHGEGSHWNDLIYRVMAEVPTCPSSDTYHGGPQIGANWASYQNTDLVTTSGNGVYTWCQETSAITGSNRVRRGNIRLSFLTWTASSTADAGHGFRPALRLS